MEHYIGERRIIHPIVESDGTREEREATITDISDSDPAVIRMKVEGNRYPWNYIKDSRLL